MKAIIFDYGGTLDTDADHWAHILWQGFCAASIPVSEDHFREAYVFAERHLARHRVILPEDNFHTLLYKKVDVETGELVRQGYWTPTEAERLAGVREVADYCNDYVVHHLKSVRPVLERLKARYRLVLVSNFYGNIETILRDYRLDGYFSAVIESAVVGVRKPDPAIYRLGVEATGFPASEVMVVGDSYDKDVVPARQVGCRTVWLKGRPWKPEEVDESLPDHIITSLPQLLDIV